MADELTTKWAYVRSPRRTCGANRNCKTSPVDLRGCPSPIWPPSGRTSTISGPQILNPPTTRPAPLVPYTWRHGVQPPLPPKVASNGAPAEASPETTSKASQRRYRCVRKRWCTLGCSMLRPVRGQASRAGFGRKADSDGANSGPEVPGLSARASRARILVRSH